MDLETLFGLPAHPLLVHAPIVMLPLATLGAILMVLPSWRRRIGWIVVGLTGLSVATIQLAIGSGQTLEEGVESKTPHYLISRHSDLGYQLRPVAVVFFLAVFGLMAYEHWQSRRENTGGGAQPGTSAGTIIRAFSVVSAITAIVAAVWVVRVGHTGAEATWHGVKVVSEGGANGGEGGEGG